MQNLIKNTLSLKIMIIFIILVFTSTGFSSGLPLGRILPKGKVILFNGNQKVGEYRSEAPYRRIRFCLFMENVASSSVICILSLWIRACFP